MPRIAEPFIIQKRKDTQHFILTLNPNAGLSSELCREWRRKSFQRLPDAVAEYRNPKSKTEAKNGVQAFIQYLKSQDYQFLRVSTDLITVGRWVKRFITLDDNPRAARLTAKNRPYSPDTIEGYQSCFKNHIEGDPLLNLKMAEVEQADILAFMSRLACQKIEGNQSMAGTRSFEITYKFVRMTFKEYQRQHPRWVDPFLSIDTPKPIKSHRPDALSEEEVIRLFMPGVLTDTMQRAVCAAMFWAGLRRSELWALQPEDLDWKTPKILIRHAWNYNPYAGSKKENNNGWIIPFNGRINVRQNQIYV